MRYFFIAWEGNKKFGRVCSCSESFPDGKDIESMLKNDHGDKSIVIRNIFEFKSKEDYDSFKGEKIK